MKKNFLLSSLLFAALFLGVNSAQAAPPPHHGGPQGGGHHSIHRPPIHHEHIHQPPRMHHHHHVRHYGGFISPCYYSSYYPIGWSSRVYYPSHHSHLGASFHISL